ncbi:hypothetical protein EGU77_22810 [Pseudomonas syringae pv. theae]|nr:hypothetical protein [Pseudomonas syringae pv. theae]MBL3869335.1 hypothetical protein [Pseudomonas syringae pv. theae]
MLLGPKLIGGGDEETRRIHALHLAAAATAEAKEHSLSAATLKRVYQKGKSPVINRALQVPLGE